jgi:hypothetical protein
VGEQGKERVMSKANPSKELSLRPLVAVAAVTLASAAGLGWLLQRAWKPKGDPAHRAARALAGAALLCASVALESARFSRRAAG